MLLVGEVADSTLVYDRGKKACLYAAAEIQEYWIVNLVDNVLEVYRNPMGSGNNAGYRIKLIYTSSEKVAPLALPTCHIDLNAVFFGIVNVTSPDTEE